ncbi:MAG: cellulase family glycosylhydrolase [Puniceicoccaceae bacterium]
MKLKVFSFALVSLALSFSVAAERDYSKPVSGQWSKEQANAWYDAQPWLVGCNYYPATAINQIEMWQASTWDPATIDKELKMAAGIGMNTLRVYLHDLVWADDEKGLYARMDEFLDICQKHGIRPFFVFFDDCHFPAGKLGKQPLPAHSFHNSGWLNCPQREVALRYADGKATKKEVRQLKGYVQRTIKRFKDDPRVLMWELYNEPGRGNPPDADFASSKAKYVIRDKSAKLVYDSWVWAREVNPSQPVSSNSAGSVGKNNIMINRVNSDIHSIHSYSPPEQLRELIHEYKKDGRPIIVTEWLARTRGSTVADCLPVLKEENVGAVNWGFVSGKSGTIWPWESRKTSDGKPIFVDELRKQGKVVKPGDPYPEPELWFHDIFREDGSPFDPDEVRIFRKLTRAGS